MIRRLEKSLQSLVQEIMDQPPDVIERMKKILSDESTLRKETAMDQSHCLRGCCYFSRRRPSGALKLHITKANRNDHRRHSGGDLTIFMRGPSPYTWQVTCRATPTSSVQNMPGAGHMIRGQLYLYVSKPDGLTLGAVNAGLYSSNS